MFPLSETPGVLRLSAQPSEGEEALCAGEETGAIVPEAPHPVRQEAPWARAHTPSRASIPCKKRPLLLLLGKSKWEYGAMSQT